MHAPYKFTVISSEYFTFYIMLKHMRMKLNNYEINNGNTNTASDKLIITTIVNAK